MNATIRKKLTDYQVINVIDKINPAFYDLWLSKHNHIIAKGGRSSMKSSVISLKLVEKKWLNRYLIWCA